MPDTKYIVILKNLSRYNNTIDFPYSFSLVKFSNHQLVNTHRIHHPHSCQFRSYPCPAAFSHLHHGDIRHKAQCNHLPTGCHSPGYCARPCYLCCSLVQLRLVTLIVWSNGYEYQCRGSEETKEFPVVGSNSHHHRHQQCCARPYAGSEERHSSFVGIFAHHFPGSVFHCHR